MSGSDFGNIPQSILDKWMTEAESGDRPRRPDVAIPVTIVLGLAVIIFVATRAWVRFRIQKKVDVADWLIFITAPMTLAYLIMVAVCVQQYYNRHLWELSDMERVVALKYFFWGYFWYFWNSALVRLSILAFYLRLTDKAVQPKFVKLVYATIVFTILYWIVFDVSLVFTCRPVKAFWRRADPAWVQAHEYKCFDEGVHIMAASAISALDLFIAVLPTMLFWNMTLPRRQKIALWGLFAIGATTGVASLVRMYFIYLDFWQSYDFTWIGYEIWLWTSTELAIAIVCASAPALKCVFIKFFGGGNSVRGVIGRLTGTHHVSRRGTNVELEQDDEHSSRNTSTLRSTATKLLSKGSSRTNSDFTSSETRNDIDLEMQRTDTDERPTRPELKHDRTDSWMTYDYGLKAQGGAIVTSTGRSSRTERLSEESDERPESPPLPLIQTLSGNNEDDMIVHISTRVEVFRSPTPAGGQSEEWD